MKLALVPMEVSASHVLLAATEHSILVHVFVMQATSITVLKHAQLATTPAVLLHVMVQTMLTASAAITRDIELF